AFAHEMAWTYGAGDDIQALRALTPSDAAHPTSFLSAGWHVGEGAGLLRRTGALLRLARDPKGGAKLAAAHCDLAVALAARLGMEQAVITALGQIYERWDGRGSPAGLAGEQISRPARVLHVCWRAEAHRRLEGPAAARDEIARRRGGELDPDLVDAFLSDAALFEQT